MSASNGIRKVCFAALRCGVADVFDGTAHSQRKKNTMYLAISYDDFMLAIIHTENTYITSGLQIFYEFVWDRLVGCGRAEPRVLRSRPVEPRIAGSAKCSLLYLSV